MDNRICSKCQEPKPLSEYYKSNITRCKPCIQAYQKNRYHGIVAIKKPIKEDETLEQRKSRIKYLGKVARNKTRKVGNKLPDREIYTLDEYCEKSYYLDFSLLKDIPMERLEVDYYNNKQEQDKIDEHLRLSDEFLKMEKKYRTLSQYEKKIRD